MERVEHKTTLERLERFSPEERAWIQEALEFATLHHAPQRRVAGEPFIIHPVAVAQTLIDSFSADADTVVAALLHDTVEDTTATLDDIERAFGKTIRQLVDGATDVGKGDGHAPILDKEERMKQTHLKIRRFAQEDPRIYLVKIADRMHNLLTCAPLRPKNRCRLAEEALSFHVPACRTLGHAAQADALERLARQVIADASRQQAA